MNRGCTLNMSTKFFTTFTVVLLVCMTMLCGTSVLAAEKCSSKTSDAGSVSETYVNIADAFWENTIMPAASIGIYSDVETLVYTGKGTDRWLHITPWLMPNQLTIRMVDYSGSTVWEETFYMTEGATHWFVGSNVKYVYLHGTPGGVVNISDTVH